MKLCSRFNSSKCASEINPQPMENFAKDVKRKDRLTLYCKSCLKSERERTKEQRSKTIVAWRKRNPDKMREYRRREMPKIVARNKKWREKNRLPALYGITKEDWNVMFDEQKGLCRLCEKHHTEFKRGLCVDHCHSSGKVRGLLCHPCNQGLGMFKDNVDFLKRAISYLNK